MSATDIAAAERRAAVARERLADTATTLQTRLRPATLARTAAQSGIDTVRRHPAKIVGVATLAGLFLARNRILALWRRKA